MFSDLRSHINRNSKKYLHKVESFNYLYDVSAQDCVYVLDFYIREEITDDAGSPGSPLLLIGQFLGWLTSPGGPSLFVSFEASFSIRYVSMS